MLRSSSGYYGPLLPLDPIEQNLKSQLQKFILCLAGRIGERNVLHMDNLNVAAEFIKTHFVDCGLEVSEQPYVAGGKEVKNIIGIKKGNRNHVIVIGAHYDSIIGSPGADDNASGVAALLAIAQLLRPFILSSTIHYVAFCTEEPPHCFTKEMGSLHYAMHLKQQKSKVKAMFSIESIGYYSTLKNSQQYPLFLSSIYPNAGDFIGFVANLASCVLLNKSLNLFRKNMQFPSEGISAPAIIPGISWSDHRSFWKMGYKAIMVTDTAPYRNPYYHSADDLPDTIDYDRTAKVTYGLALMLKDFAN